MSHALEWRLRLRGHHWEVYEKTPSGSEVQILQTLEEERARLIAAAPALVDALRRAGNLLGECAAPAGTTQIGAEWRSVQHGIRAVLAKMEGGPQG